MDRVGGYYSSTDHNEMTDIIYILQASIKYSDWGDQGQQPAGNKFKHSGFVNKGEIQRILQGEG